jgi:hypothetical protein
VRQLRFVCIVSALSIVLAVILYFPTFRLPFAYDDVDYINLGARLLAGEMSVLDALFTPHSEHLVAGCRALFFPYLYFFGLDAFAWRVFIVIVHALSAVFLAILARRYAGSTRAGIATAIVYIGACGFSAMWIWFPTGATVPLMMLLLNAAAALLAWRDHLTVRRFVAAGLVILALLTESAFAPMALFPALIDEYERRRAGQRRIGWFSIATLLSIAGAFVLVTVIFRNASGVVSINPWAGLPRAAFLLVAAPFRFFFPGISVISSSVARVAILVAVVGTTIAAVVLALLVALWRRRVPPLATIAVLALPGALGVLTLIGLGRWNFSWQTLYDTDRYFFPLMIPLSLLAGAIAGSISFDGWPRLARALVLTCVAIAVFGELALQRRAMLAPIPRPVYAKHDARFASLQRLMNLLNDAGPIDIPRQTLWFADLHNGKLRTEILTAIICGNGRCPRVRLGGETVDAATAARLNPILDRWAHESGERVPFIRVVDGRLLNTRVQWHIDSVNKPLTIASQKLEVVMAAPVAQTVHAKLVDIQSGLTFPLESVTITHQGPQTHVFSTRPMYSVVGEGRPARLILECERRPHCVQFFSAGSAGDKVQ